MRRTGVRITKTRIYSNIACMLLFAYLLFVTSIGKTAELTAQQQAMIANHLTKLESIVNQSKADLAILSNQLVTSQAELSEAKERLLMLNEQLQELHTTSNEQQTLLKNAEEYCKKLEQNQAPLTLNEYSVQLDATTHVDGVGYGRYWKLPKKILYIGVRGTYNWEDSKSGLWLSLLI